MGFFVVVVGVCVCVCVCVCARASTWQTAVVTVVTVVFKH